MKRIIFLLLFCATMVSCSLSNKTEEYPKANSKSMDINDYALTSDGSNIAISTREGSFIYNTQKDVLNKIEPENGEAFSNYFWINNSSGWKFLRMDDDSNLPVSKEKLVFTENILEGEIYDQRYNLSGILELRLISWKDKKVLAIVNRKNGEFNVLGDMDGAESINVYNLSSDGAIIKVSYGKVINYRLYFKSIGKLSEINTTNVKDFHESLKSYLGKNYKSASGKFYKRDINLENFEIIDLSCKNNLILSIDNSGKKLMVYNIKTSEITPVNTEGILNAVTLNNDEIYIIAKSDKTFIVQSINLKNIESRRTLFFTNEFLYKLWEYDNKVYFVGVITKPGENKYKFYRVLDKEVENLFDKWKN